MNSPFANIYEAISTRLLAELTKQHLRFIDLELGQMEAYDPNKPGSKPQVSFPAALIDFETTNFQDLGELIQKGEVIVLVRACFEQISATDSLTPTTYRQKGLGYFDIEWRINKALHGWSPGEGYGYLTRIAAVTEQRPDNYRVRQLRYKMTFTDKSTMIQVQQTPSGYELESEFKTGA